MPKYLIQRRFHVAENEMPRVGRRSRQVIEEEFPEITWHHSHVVVDDQGVVKSYCVYEAPSEEIVLRHSRQLGEHVVEEVYEIAGDVTPEDFPPI
jgi:Protein of unknown function (DUF4242)